MHIRKVFNNNVLLAITDDGEEHIVMGRGIAFGAHAGQPVDLAKATQTFVSVGGGESLSHINSLISEIPLGILNLAAELAEQAHREFGVAPTAGFVVPLADHLAVAARRVGQDAPQHPLATEVRQFYPRELAFGRSAVNQAVTVVGAKLPAGEEFAIALHLVNAQFSGENFAATVRLTKTVRQVLDIVDALVDKPVDRESARVARFLTHLRYLFARLDATSSEMPDIAIPVVEGAMRSEHPDAYRAAQRMAYLIESATGHALGRNDITYLTLHVVRVTVGN